MRLKRGRLSRNAGRELNPPDTFVIIRSNDTCVEPPWGTRATDNRGRQFLNGWRNWMPSEADSFSDWVAWESGSSTSNKSTFASCTHNIKILKSDLGITHIHMHQERKWQHTQQCSPHLFVCQVWSQPDAMQKKGGLTHFCGQEPWDSKMVKLNLCDWGVVTHMVDTGLILRNEIIRTVGLKKWNLTPIRATLDGCKAEIRKIWWLMLVNLIGLDGLYRMMHHIWGQASCFRNWGGPK